MKSPNATRKLILEQPEPVAAAPAADAPATRIEIPEAPAAPEPKVAEKRRAQGTPRTGRRVAAKPKVAPDKGVQGGNGPPKEVTQNLAQVTGSLDKALDELTNASADRRGGRQGFAEEADRKRRGTRGGRGTAQLASVSGVSNLETADIGGTSLSNDAVAIAGIADLSFGGWRRGGGAEAAGRDPADQASPAAATSRCWRWCAGMRRASSSAMKTS